MSGINITCISAGMIKPKKKDNPIARMHMYLNYGLLGLASILHNQGYKPIVLHGNFEEPKEFVNSLNRRGLLASSIPVLLSIPSSFAIEWARQATTAIRELHPKIRIIVGGRWVVANDQEWIRSKLPIADEFIEGLAEGQIKQIIESPGTPTAVKPNASPPLNYLLLDNWQKYQPSVEVSRGCGMHCNFCAEAEVPLGPMKSAKLVADEIELHQELVEHEDFNVYFETSIFRPSSAWIDKFSNEISIRRLRFQWRTESRVDTLNPNMISKLSKTGLKVIDLAALNPRAPSNYSQ